MTQSGSWSAFAGRDAIFLAAALFFIGGVLILLGARLDGSIEPRRPGKAVGFLLVMIGGLSLATFLVAITVYMQALMSQVPSYTSPPNPITPVTAVSTLVTFFTIIYLGRQSGLKTALGSAILGVIAAPMIFELPFDLIVMGRTYPPQPAAQYTLLFFLPLFLVELSSFTLLSLSPLTRVSRYTFFALAVMFLVFAIWALFGFAYPSSPLPIACNALSKVVSFVAAITLFLPEV